MTDAIVSFVVDKLRSTVTEHIKNKIDLPSDVDRELNSLSNELETIKNVLDDAENRKFKDKNINDWLSRIREISHEIRDILEECNFSFIKLKIEDEHEHDQSNHVVALPKQKVFSSFPSSSYFGSGFMKNVDYHDVDVGKKIQNVKAQLELILAEKDQFKFLTNSLLTEWRKVQTTSLIYLEKVQGRDSEKDNLVRKIISKEARLGLGNLRVVSIVGVGGLGKTTLAQLVYNDGPMKEYFDLRVWIYLSGSFDEIEIAKGIIQKLEGKWSCDPETKQSGFLLEKITRLISGKKFLLVLDNVQINDWRKWEPLRDSLMNGGVGSTVLMTTRNIDVVKRMGTMDDDIYRLGQLSNEDCYMLLCRTTENFGRNEVNSKDFERIGREIANKCNGLPLAVKVLGGLLRSKHRLDEWENILKNEIWKLNVAKVNIFPYLLLSYKELTLQQKHCFSYCGAFPKDFYIYVPNLIDYWRVLGYLGSSSSAQDLELKGRECFDILAMRSLFQDFSEDHKYCKMHDIVHDFAQLVRKNAMVEAGLMDKMTTFQLCGRFSLVSHHVKEYCSLLSEKVIEARLMQKTTTFQSCRRLSLVSHHVKEYHSLLWEKVTPPDLCDACLGSLKVLKIECYSNWKTIPKRMNKMIHLRLLDLSYNDLSSADLGIVFQLYSLQVVNFSKCDLQNIPTEIGNLYDLISLDLRDNSLKELPSEIGNLIHLRVLDLGGNYELNKLPESICSLLELQILDITLCTRISRLPKGIHCLTNLKYLYNESTYSLCQFPKGLAQLTGLCGMTEFRGGNGWSKLGLLKNINKLGGSFDLHIRLLRGEELKGVVEDARQTELRKKKDIEDLSIWFHDEMEEEEKGESAMRMDVIDALEPHANLQKLTIWRYKGSKLAPGWLQTLNLLRRIKLSDMGHVSSLPPLWKLSCLEEIEIKYMYGLQFVGRDFLGITTTTVEGEGYHMHIAFPKLKKLVFYNCPIWNKWEDIMPAEEEEETEEKEGVAISLMPCLTELIVERCPRLMALPNCLIRQAPSLEKLVIDAIYI